MSRGQNIRPTLDGATVHNAVHSYRTRSRSRENWCNMGISPCCIFTSFSHTNSRKRHSAMKHSNREVERFKVQVSKRIKVHIFWEAHKILRNLHRKFVLCSASQIYGEDFAKFCGLFQILKITTKTTPCFSTETPLISVSKTETPARQMYWLYCRMWKNALNALEAQR